MSPRLRTISSLLSSSSYPASSSPSPFVNRHRPSRRSREHARAAALFSTTSRAFAEPNYYEILNVPVTASTAEIKKQFYALSLTHHPDRNRDDPNATARFANISSAYNVLGNNSKRARYDRDHSIMAHNTSSTHSTATAGQHPMGSHSSHGSSLHKSYVGSRPASGLSKRRGPFKGPPPSFYAHGGYGRTGRTEAGAGASSSSSSSAAGGGAGAASSEEDPTSFINQNPVHHFNARSHFRTQAAEDERRQRRRMRDLGLDMNPNIGGSPPLRFLAVCGILAGAGMTAGMFAVGGGSGSKKGTRRGE
ncbi:DnaJ domain protein [Paecilomyces variotii No. 5]|uniref:DnaJ domain protein n=1 Tax=Byssochlamys spectabilis (strain No. 5 / NBRC 109023) TaxID=1356009 RepID=V5FU15_BYSSN|nr:DnaJ domain protein [Paecilomyces variotii No. 5]